LIPDLIPDLITDLFSNGFQHRMIREEISLPPPPY
jgi:hypothetical protein